MNPQDRVRPTMLIAVLALAAFVLGGCETEIAAPHASPIARPTGRDVMRSVPADRALEDRILALDPERVTADDVKNTLARGPTPQIMLIHGGIVGVYLAMVSTGQFLVAMGYPEDRIRHPGGGAWSNSCYQDSIEIAGDFGWYYERDGMRPMMIGHSQGGVQAVKVLYQLAGKMDNPIPVHNPTTDETEKRTTILDPLTGKERTIIGLSASYVSGLDSGGIMMILPNQWKMLDKLRDIPNNVVDFTGFTIGVDFWPWPIPGFEGSTPYRSMGTAKVRNVILPTTYDHVDAPYIAALGDIPSGRAWVDEFRPDKDMPTPPPETAGYALYWIGDVWYSIKKHWTLEAQRVIRARRAGPDQPVAMH